MKNEYKIFGNTTVVYCGSLEGIMEVLIDTDDLPKLLERNWTWRCRYSKSKGMYVYGDNNPLHRFILNAQPGDIIDHIDQNTLNNMKSNLRKVTPTESMRNRGVFKNNTSGHTGVTWRKQYNKWEAFIWVNGKRRYLGRFINLDNAVQAREKAEKEYWV